MTRIDNMNISNFKLSKPSPLEFISRILNNININFSHMNDQHLSRSIFYYATRALLSLTFLTVLFNTNQANGQCNITANYQTLNACYDTPVVLKATQSTGGNIFTEGFNTFTAVQVISETPEPINSFVVTGSNNNSSMVQITGLATEGVLGLVWDIAEYSTNDLSRLTGPTVDLSNNATVQLKFDHRIYLAGGTTNPIPQMIIEYSSDNGATWQVFPASSYAGTSTTYTTANSYFTANSYAGWDAAAAPGDTTSFQTETFNIPTAALTAQFKMRFKVSIVEYVGGTWYIDNVRISSTASNSHTQGSWSPTTSLFTNAAFTTPYTGGLVDSVWLKPTANGNYVVSKTTGVCTAKDTVEVTVYGSFNAINDTTYCSNSASTNININGGSGNTYTTTSTQHGTGVIGSSNSPIIEVTPNNTTNSIIKDTVIVMAMYSSPVTYTLTDGAYTFTDTTGSTYLNLTSEYSGTNLLSTQKPIGFNFNFYGTSFSNIYINRRGSISFTPNLSDQKIIFGQNRDQWIFDATTRIAYKTIGTAPNRKFVVSFINLKIPVDFSTTTQCGPNSSQTLTTTTTYTADPTAGYGVFQIILNETSNVIESAKQSVPSLSATVSSVSNGCPFAIGPNSTGPVTSNREGIVQGVLQGIIMIPGRNNGDWIKLTSESKLFIPMGGTNCPNGKKDTFTIAVLPTPKVDSIANMKVCPGSTVPAINFTTPIIPIAIGSTVGYKWANNNTAIGLAASGFGNIPSFTAAATAQSSTISVTPYMLKSATDTCFGTVRTFNIAADLPAAPTTTGNLVVYTGTKTISQLAVTPLAGGSLNYFYQATGGTALAGSTIVVDDTTYYVTQTLSGCESNPRKQIKVNRIANDSIVVCSPANVAGLTTTPQTGSTAKWFTTATGGTALADTTSIPTGTNTIYVEESDSTTSTLFNYNVAGNLSFLIDLSLDEHDSIYYDTYFEGEKIYRAKPDGTGSTLIYQGSTATTASINSIVYEKDNSNRYLYFATTRTLGRLDLNTLTRTLIDSSSSYFPMGQISRDAENNKLYFASNRKVYVRNLTTGIVTALDSVPSAFSLIASYFSPSTNSLYFGDYQGGKVYRKILATGVRTDSISVLKSRHISQMPDGRIIIACESSLVITNPDLTNPITVATSTSAQTVFYAAQPDSKGNIIFIEPFAMKKLTLNKSNRVPVTVIANPTPNVLSTADTTVCNGSTIPAINFATTTSGTVTYNWTNDNTSIGLAASGTGNIASFVATNPSTPVATTATIIVTPTITNAGISCEGVKDTFLIVVNPTIGVRVIPNQVVCNGSPTTAVSLDGRPRAAAITVYNWTNNTPSIGLAASGSGNIRSFTAINNGNATVTATIIVTPNYTNNGVSCDGTPRTFTIAVLPSPKVDSIGNVQVCPVGMVSAINFNSPTMGTVGYKWINNNTAIGLAASGAGNIASFTASNTDGMATVSVTPYIVKTVGDTCFGTARSFTISVENPPAPTTGSCVIYTGSKTLSQLAVTPLTGGTLNYYYQMTGGTSLPGSTIVVDDTTYYVSQSVTGCESLRKKIKVNRIANDSLVFCSPDTVGSLVATPILNNPIRWYDSPTASTPLTNITPLALGTDTLYVEEGSLNSENIKTILEYTSPQIQLYSLNLGLGDSLNYIAGPAPNSSIRAIKTDGTGDRTVKPLENMNFYSLLEVDSAGQKLLFGTSAGQLFRMNLTTGVNTSLQGNGTFGDIYDMEYDSVKKLIYFPSAGSFFNPKDTIWKYDIMTGVFTKIAAVSSAYKLALVPSNVPGSDGALFIATANYTLEKVELTPTPTKTTIIPNTSLIQIGDIDGTPDGRLLARWQNVNSTTEHYLVTMDQSGTILDTLVTFNKQLSIIPNEVVVKSNNEFFFAEVQNPARISQYKFTPANISNRVPVIVITNPKPIITPTADQAVCNDASVPAINFASATTGGSISYAWTNNTTSIGLAASGAGNIASFTATNTGTAPDTARVIVTPTLTNAGQSCPGTPDTFLIIVNPTGRVNAIRDTVVCAGAVLDAVTPKTTNTGGITTYVWVNDNTSIGLFMGSSGNVPSFTATNNGTSPITANINVRPRFTNARLTCDGPRDTFKVTVNPTITVTAIPDATYTKGSTVAAVTPVTAATGGTVSYTWTNSNTSIGLAASGTESVPSFTAANTGTAPITGTIVITPSFANGGKDCAGTQETYIVTINPMAMITNGPQDTTTYSNGATAAGYTPTTSATGGTMTYTWTNNTPSIGLAASGTGPVPSFTTVNTGTAPLTACIIVTPTFTLNGVSSAGVPDTFYITANPTAMISPALPDVVVTPDIATTAITPMTTATGGTTTFAWTNSNPSIGLGASGSGPIPSFTPENMGTAPITATIIVTPTFSNGGVNSVGTPDTFIITVNPIVMITNEPQDTTTYSNGSSIPGYTPTTSATGGTVTYAWTNNIPAIGLPASGTGPVPAFTATNTGTTPLTACIIVTPTFTLNGVSSTGMPDTFYTTVNPTAILSPALPNVTVSPNTPTTAITPMTSATGGTTTFAWTNSNPTIGLGASGSGPIPSFTPVNTSTAPITSTIIVTPTFSNGGVNSVGTPDTFIITVNPIVMITNEPQDTTTYSNGSSIPGYTPATSATGGTVTYAWTNNAPAIGLPASGTGPVPAFTGTNTGTSPLTACIIVTPTFTLNGIGSTGMPDTFYTTVNPTATLSPALPDVTVSPNTPTTAITPMTSATGGTTTFAWTNNAPGIGLPSSGSGPIPSFIPVNTGTSPIISTIIVTPTFSNGGINSVGTPDTIMFTVNPTAIISNPQADMILSVGSSVPTYTPTTTATGGTVTYAWTNNNTSTGLGASGTGSVPAFTTTNTGTAPIVSQIIVTPTFTLNGVATPGRPDTINITVNPIAMIVAIRDTLVCSDILMASIVPMTTATGGTTTYTWTNSNTAIGLAASGNGNIPSFTTTNTSIAPIMATIIVTPTFTNANGGSPSVGTPDTFMVTVNPTAIVNPISNQSVCAGTTVNGVDFGTTATGGTVTYSWTNNTPSIGLPASGSGNIASFTGLNGTPNPVTATITITPTFSNGGIDCQGTPRTFTITVNPYLTLGNQVWIDDVAGVNATDYDGIRNGAELGIDGVKVQLYTPTGTLLQTVTTATFNGIKGLYLFDSLCPGDFVVVIPGSELMPGGPLQNYLSSSGTFNAGGPYEVSAGIDPDNSIDNEDDGTFKTNSLHNFAVVSNTISLVAAGEPLNENPDNDLISQDANENLTVDFGFIPKVFDLAMSLTTLAIQPVDSFNSEVKFCMNVYNQGNMDADFIELTDYLPSGLMYSTKNDTIGVASGQGTGWSLTGSNAKYTINKNLKAGDSTKVNFYIKVQMSTLNNAYLNFAEISNASDTLGNTPASGPYGQLKDIDSTPDAINGNDDGAKEKSPNDNFVLGNGLAAGGAPGDALTATDEDDHDVALIEVVDVAIINTITTMGPYTYGQTVGFELGIINQGNVDLYNVVIKDTIPAGMMFGPNNPGWSLVGNVATFTIPGPIMMGDTVKVPLMLVLQPVSPASSATASSWTNTATVAQVTSQSGANITLDDIDIDGISIPGKFSIYDLAFTKTVRDLGKTYLFGDTITFNMTVYNQGNAPVYNVEISDYITPAITQVNAGPNTGWTFASDLATYIVPGPIQPGTSVTIPLDMIFKAGEEFKDYINFGEISDFASSANGPTAMSGALKDADSTPDRVNGNDAGGSPSGAGSTSRNDNYIDGNGKGTPESTDALTDEDDHDPVLLGFVDLALTKKLVGTTDKAYTIGQNVDFVITVYNQGSLPADSILLYDFFLPGFTLNDTDWELLFPYNASITVAAPNGSLAFGDSMQIPITLKIDSTFKGYSLINRAEVVVMYLNGTDLAYLDIDSEPDLDPTNDAGGAPNTPSDNAINGNGFTGGTPGSVDPITDEDDSDPAYVKVYQILNDYRSTDPCSCNNDQTANGAKDGSFNETVSVATTSVNEIWTVKSFGPLRVGGTLPTGISVGQLFTFDATNNRHVKQFKHFDGSGYFIEMEGPYAANDVRNVVLRESSVCVYPELKPIAQMLACDSTNIINLVALASEVKALPGTLTVTLNGSVVTSLDPKNLPKGYSDLKFVFQATPGVDPSNGTLANPANPGCMTNVDMIIFGGGLPITCNNSLNISLDQNCQAVITPEVVMENAQYGGLGYKVTLKVDGTPIAGNVLNSSQIGKKVEVSVVDPCDGNSCWGSLKIEDKLPPVAICPTLPEILCTDAVVFPALQSLDCSPVTVTYTDTKAGDDCTGRSVTRTWRLVDAYGNIGNNCVQTIKMKPLSIDSILMPKSPLEISACSNVSTRPSSLDSIAGVATADVMPYVLVNGVPRGIESNLCNIFINYKDVTVPLSCGKKIVRTWSILDWCTQRKKEHIQLIKISDTTKPVVTAPADMTVGVSPWTCEAEFVLPAGSATDNCDASPVISINGPLGVSLIGRTVKGLKPGSYTFTYIATDNCENVSNSKTVTVTVVDNSAPVMIAKEKIVINLTSNGNTRNDTILAEGKIFAANVDNGSYDMCSGVKLEVRRKDINTCDDQNDEWRDYVKFCCEDVGGRHMVELRATDSSKNSSITWVEVLVEAKSAADIECFSRDVNCSTNYGFSAAEKAVSSLSTNYEVHGDISCAKLSETYQDRGDLNQCNVGTVIRTFRLYQGTKAIDSCEQTITVLPNASSLTVGNTTDKTIYVNTCTLPQDSINKYKPVVSGGSCDIIGENINVDTFKIEDGVCKKWIVTYTYINWCNVNQKAYRTVKFAYEDKTPPVVSAPDTIMVEAGNTAGGGSGSNATECAGTVTLKASASDIACEGSTGWLKWTVSVDLNGDGSIDRWFSSSLPSTHSDYIKPTTSGAEVVLPSFSVANSGKTHKVLWSVSDGCGNSGVGTSVLLVSDKKAPTPYCLFLSTALMVNCQVEVWAKDFDKQSFDNCTPYADLLFTFDGANPVLTKLTTVHYFTGVGVESTEAEYLKGNAQKWNPEAKSSGKLFTKPETTEVKMSVWDGKLNTDFCEVTLTIIDNQNACDGSRIAIGGDIQTEKGEGIKNVNVELSSIMPTYPKNQMSDINGDYMFGELPMNMDYTVKGIKRDDWMNGVSTIDLVLIQRHILGISKLTSPYKIVAADVNNDGKVTASDLVILRKLILGVIAELPNNNSWRFLDASTSILNPSSPWPLDETIIINGANQDMMKENFIGLKVGDVNNNAQAATGITPDSRSKKELEMKAEDKEVKEGEVIELPIRSKNFSDIYGYQFTTNLSGLEVIGMLSGALEVNASNYGTPKAGIMTMSWQTDKAANVADGEVLFTIQLRAKNNGKLSEMMTVSSDITRSESYAGSSMEVNRLSINFAKQAIEAVTELYQNEPNPFKDETVIKYNMAATGKASFTLYDITGKKILVKEVEATKGMNTLRLTRGEINAYGVVYYQMKVGEFKVTKNMIIID